MEEFPDHEQPFWMPVKSQPFFYRTPDNDYSLGAVQVYQNKDGTQEIYTFNFLNRGVVLKIWRILKRKVHRPALLSMSGKWVFGQFVPEEEIPFQIKIISHP